MLSIYLLGCCFRFSFSLINKDVSQRGRRWRSVSGTWCFCQCPFLLSTHSVCLIPASLCQDLWPRGFDISSVQTGTHVTWATGQGRPLPARESSFFFLLPGGHTMQKNPQSCQPVCEEHSPTWEWRNEKIFKGELDPVMIFSQGIQNFFFFLSPTFSVLKLQWKYGVKNASTPLNINQSRDLVFQGEKTQEKKVFRKTQFCPFQHSVTGT